MRLSNIVVKYPLLLVACIVGIAGKPSFSFNFPTLGSFGTTEKDSGVRLKHYSGGRVSEDSLVMVYHNDQTVAVVELGPRKLLLNCELIEISKPNQVKDVLGNLKRAKPMVISFEEMLTLMDQCAQLQEIKVRKSFAESTQDSNNLKESDQSRGIKNPLTILNGILPGTKWCGTGDIATDYFDLGADKMVDMCCRAHDLCPVKVRAYTQRYNLTNNSLYTKSHCKCDDNLFRCLKKAGNSASANIMGTIYFNLVQVPCLEEVEGRVMFRNARSNF